MTFGMIIVYILVIAIAFLVNIIPIISQGDIGGRGSGIVGVALMVILLEFIKSGSYTLRSNIPNYILCYVAALFIINWLIRLLVNYLIKHK